MQDALINTFVDVMPTALSLAITVKILKSGINFIFSCLRFENTSDNKEKQTKQTEQQEQNKKFNTFDELALIVKYMKMKRRKKI